MMLTSMIKRGILGRMETTRLKFAPYNHAVFLKFSTLYLLEFNMFKKKILLLYTLGNLNSKY